MTQPIALSALTRLCPDSARYQPHLLPAMQQAGITTPIRQAHFLAQIAVESAAFRRVRESLNYSIDGLQDVFGPRRISTADAARFGRAGGRPADQRAIANTVYGGDWGRRNLGNTQAGDGWRFIGRGLKQVTGRSNYAELDRELQLGGLLLAEPERLEEPAMAVRSAIWFWSDRGLNEVADQGRTPAAVQAVTLRVNGGTNGLRDRQAWFDKFARALAL